MGYARYIGRIGVLAAALGVSAVVAKGLLRYSLGAVSSRPAISSKKWAIRGVWALLPVAAVPAGVVSHPRSRS